MSGRLSQRWMPSNPPTPYTGDFWRGPHAIVPSDVEYTRSEVSPPLSYGVRVCIPKEMLVNAYDARRELYDYMQHLQHKAGIGLVDAIWRAGGLATVELRLLRHTNHQSLTEDFDLRAEVQPAAMMTPVVKVSQPHLDYFPADWVCVYCGQLNNGLKHPRVCCGCQAPKDLQWEEKV